MKYSLIVLSLLVSFLSFSQDDVKRNTYKGNIFYHDSEFEDAKYYYEKAVNESGFNFKANYNLANTYLRLEEFEKAIETYEKIAEYTNTAAKKSNIYHNIGNSQMLLLSKASKDKTAKAGDLLKKLEDAIESYKTALKANPRDEETRYNLAYALLIKKQLEEQKKKEKKSDDKNESEEDKDSDDKKDGDKSDSDKNKKGDSSEDKDKDGEPEDEEKDVDKKDEKDSDGNGDQKDQKPKQQKISNEQAKRILEAAEKAEKEIQNKLNKQKVIVGEKGKKGTKKDW